MCPVTACSLFLAALGTTGDFEMMLCGIFLLLMLWTCEGARLAGKNYQKKSLFLFILIESLTVTANL